MSVSTGQVNKRYVSAISYLDQREIEKNILDIQNESDFLDVFLQSGRYELSKVGNYHHFVNDPLFVVGDTTGATIVGSGAAATLTGVTLTAATSGFAKIGTLALLPNAKVARVSAISTASSQDTLTLVSVDGTNLTLVAGNKLSFFSNAQEEESSAPTSQRYSMTKYFNKLQIFRESDTISDIQKVSKIETSTDFMVYQHIYKVKSLRAQIGAAFIAGKMSAASFEDATPSGLVGANGNSIQTTRGLDDYVSTYGVSDSLTSAGTVALADVRDLVSQLAVIRSPKDYMVWLNTVSYAIYSDFLKGQGTSGVQSGKLTLDGKTLDLNVDSFKYAGYSFDFSLMPILDHAQLFNFTGSAGIQKNAYFVPKDSVGTVDGGVLPRIRLRYLPQPMEGGTGDMIRETHQGMLAPIPVGRQANWTTDWYTIQGLEILGAQHFVKQQVQA